MYNSKKPISNPSEKIFSLLRLLTLLIFFSGSAFQSALAQVYSITEISSRFLRDADYDSLIYEKALPLASERKMSQQELKERMFPYRSKFAEAIWPLLHHDFMIMDKRYGHIGNGNTSYAPTRKIYLNAVKNAVERAFEYPSSFYPVFSINITDRILSFHSEVTIEADGTIHVSETITVYNGDGRNSQADRDTLPSENDDIQRGIVRDFPTKYLDSNGLWHTTGFRVKQVLKNGQEEPYISESLENGKRLFIGEESKILEPGIYTYRIGYTTKRQLIFHGDKDEFYWNVNGNGWVFTVDSVSCTIHFPDQSQLIEWNCYTGIQGSTAKDCKSVQLDNSTIKFYSSGRLQAYEGLTVAVSINKGVLAAPGNVSKGVQLIADNSIVPILLILSGALFYFYYSAWKRKGRDPEKGVIYPQFEPPAGLSPADTGYILHQKFDTHLFAAALVDAAVHQQLEIDVEKKGLLNMQVVYQFNPPSGNGHSTSSPILNRNGVPYSAAPVGSDTTRYGFPISSIYGEVAQKGKYNSKLKILQAALEKDLKKKFLAGKNQNGTMKGLFRLNSLYVGIGTIVFILALLGSLFFIANNFTPVLLTITIVILILLLTIHIVFARIMKAYTPEGRKIADSILGFKMYLQTAEQRYYDQLTPPEKTLELFEKYLPYAIALKVENEWAEKFEDQIRLAMESGYRPAYYHTQGGFGGNFGLSDLSKGLSSGLSSTISSASTPPSSSRGGSGGGGRSGGGGGGGGGGGW